MTSAYFASVVNLPIIVIEPGQYVTRAGETIVITAVSMRHDFGCKGTYPNGIHESWHRSGRIFTGQECSNDIVSKI